MLLDYPSPSLGVSYFITVTLKLEFLHNIEPDIIVRARAPAFLAFRRGGIPPVTILVNLPLVIVRV